MYDKWVCSNLLKIVETKLKLNFHFCMNGTPRFADSNLHGEINKLEIKIVVLFLGNIRKRKTTLTKAEVSDKNN